MPIRFRCAYCSQLMGIARRKSGSVVRCPKCSGQMVVPAQSERALQTPPPTPDPSSAAEDGTTSTSAFEFEDPSGILKSPVRSRPNAPPDTDEIDVEPLFGAGQDRGVFLTTRHLLLAGGLVVLLLVGAFLLGWFLGRP